MVKTDFNTLAGYVKKMADAQVLCIGDLMLDRFVYGTVERVSPEAPIPVVRVEQEETMLGGAGNVLRNIIALGARCTFISVIGRDDGGTKLTDLVAKLENVEAYLLREANRPSTIKTRFLAGGQQLLRADRETSALLSHSTEEDVRRSALEAIATCDAVVLSDYGKGVLTENCIRDIIVRARVDGKPVIVDPKGDFSRYRGATVVTPNSRELSEASGMATNGEEEIVCAARKLIADFDIGAMLVTRSQDGMSLVDASEVEHVEVKSQEVFDVSGAGDTVVAAFAAALAVGIPRLDSVLLANLAAGIVVGKVGTAAVYGDDLVNAVRNQNHHEVDSKIVTETVALEKVQEWRRRGERVGFANGCFDLLHPGHISLLRQARASCDHLVVGLNSDSSATRLKGEGRPVQNENARSRVLSSLSAVDLVVVFSDDTPINLIQLLMPDVLVKGSDYEENEVVGADIVKNNGGAVLLATIEQGYSTTDTIARIATH